MLLKNLSHASCGYMHVSSCVTVVLSFFRVLSGYFEGFFDRPPDLSLTLEVFSRLLISFDKLTIFDVCEMQVRVFQVAETVDRYIGMNSSERFHFE